MAQRRGAAVLLALGVGLAACDSGGPTGTDAPRAASVEAYAGVQAQTADAGALVAVAPAVLVRDAAGSPLGGAMVTWSVTRGGGGLERASSQTDTRGIATPGTWRLGDPGENEVQARVGSQPPVVFRATATAPQAFSIAVREVGTMTPRQRQALQSAVARWESVMTADLPDVPLQSAAGSCFPGQPAFNALVDDLVLFVEFVEIDGAGNVLGEAGPCYVRSESRLPIMGYLKLDVADLARLEQTGTLDDVVLHEIGHVLGIGTLWSYKGLLQGAGTEDPRFIGSQAVQAYRSLGGLEAGIAVENNGGAGTRDGHWRESVFGNELMTGWVGSVPNPLSAMTIASLQDLGYGATSLRASQYTLGATFGRAVAEGVDLRGRERVKKPKYKVDREGRRSPLQE